VRIWRLILTSPTLIAVGLTGLNVSALWAAESRLIRTAQMWGTEFAEGKVSASIGIAGECVQRDDRTLTCQFASIGINHDGQCVVSTWSERLQFVRRSPEIVTWSGSRGREGLSAGMTTSTLTAERSAGANAQPDFFNTSGPGPFDAWNYKSTQNSTTPPLGGKVLRTVSTDVKSGSPPPTLRCTNTAIIAVSPTAEE
jgi:hypothetical protein